MLVPLELGIKYYGANFLYAFYYLFTSRIFSMNFVVCYYSYVLTNVWFPFNTAQTTYSYQPLIYALQNYRRGQATNAKPVEKFNTGKQLAEEEEEEEEEEDDQEYYQEPPKYVYKPLIVVPFELLRALGKNLRPNSNHNVAQSSSDEEDDDEEIPKEKLKKAENSLWRDGLTLPFKLLQTYGIPALAQYFPAIEKLRTYGQFYENLTRSTDSKAVAELKEEVTEFKENLRKGSRKSAINGQRVSTYETFNEYFPYLIILVKLGSYFVPGLGQVKTALIGLEVVRISWKTASMYNNGDSWYDILQGLGREAIGAVIGKREELQPLTSPLAQTAFVDVASMDLDTFMTLVEESTYPPLGDEDQATLREDVTMIVNSYFGREDLTAEKKDQIIATIEMVAKFIALHAIIPAFSARTSVTESP